jgi:hypothetical protein
MQFEKRCWGDYMQWDYALHDSVWSASSRSPCDGFHERNFGDGALANQIMGSRFDVEVARHFHPVGKSSPDVDVDQERSRLHVAEVVVSVHQCAGGSAIWLRRKTQEERMPDVSGCSPRPRSK